MLRLIVSRAECEFVRRLLTDECAERSMTGLWALRPGIDVVSWSWSYDFCMQSLQAQAVCGGCCYLEAASEVGARCASSRRSPGHDVAFFASQNRIRKGDMYSTQARDGVHSIVGAQGVFVVRKLFTDTTNSGRRPLYRVVG